MHDVRRVAAGGHHIGHRRVIDRDDDVRIGKPCAAADPVELSVQVLGRPWTVVIVLMTFPALRIGARWHRRLQRHALQHRWFGSVPSCSGRRLALV